MSTASDTVSADPPSGHDEQPDKPVDEVRMAPAPEHRSTYREVFSYREFRFLYGSLTLSLVGDQLAKVALSILVYRRTGSPALTALTYSISMLPWILGAPLSAFGDRMPRRQILIFSDLARFVLIALMALPGLRVGVLVVMLLAASMFTPPFESARSAVTPEILPGDAYVVGNSLINTTTQVAIAAGLFAGGALVSAVSARGALLIDSSTFLLSALLIRIGLAARPAAERSNASSWEQITGGARLVFGSRQLRTIVLVVWLASAFTFAWEGVAAPWAAELDSGARTVGLLLGSASVGMIVGSIVIGRLCPPPVRRTLMLPLAVLSPAVLGLVLLFDGRPGALVAVFLAGFAVAFNLPLNALFVRSVPAQLRSRAFGIAQGGLQASQGLAVIAAGLVADTVSVNHTVAAFGLIGGLVILPLVLTWPRDARI